MSIAGVVLCATTDIRLAWARGAHFGASAYGTGFQAVLLGRQRCSSTRGMAELELDEVLHDEDIAIDSAERRKAVDALERAKSVPFPNVITIVK